MHWAGCSGKGVRQWPSNHDWCTSMHPHRLVSNGPTTAATQSHRHPKAWCMLNNLFSRHQCTTGTTCVGHMSPSAVVGVAATYKDTNMPLLLLEVSQDDGTAPVKRFPDRSLHCMHNSVGSCTLS